MVTELFRHHDTEIFEKEMLQVQTALPTSVSYSVFKACSL